MPGFRPIIMLVLKASSLQQDFLRKVFYQVIFGTIFCLHEVSLQYYSLFYSTSLILARLSQNWMLTKHCKISNFFQDISGQYYGWPLPPKMQNIKMKQTKHNSGIVRVCEMKLMFKKWYLVVFLCGKVQSKRKWLMQLRNGLNTGVKIQRTIVQRNSQS